MRSGRENEPQKQVNWTQSRLTRLTQGGSKGAQASIIGFVLVGPVIGGFLIGWWLDERLGTSYWTIVLGLLGVFSGFREMFQILKRLAPKPGERTPPPGRSAPMDSPKRPSSWQGENATSRVEAAQDATAKPKLFTVPPPPFMEDAAPLKKSPSQDEMLSELLGVDEEAEKSGDSAKLDAREMPREE